MAQTTGALFLGAAFPLGSYAKGTMSDNANDWVLTNANIDNHHAGASIGGNVGLKVNFGLGVPGLSVMLSVDGFYNGLNNNLKEYFDDKVIEMKNNQLVNSYKLSRPKYINTPVMVGINHVIYLGSKFGLFFEGGIGCNARFITNYNETIKYVANVTTETTYKYKPAFSFAYQLGTGFEINEKIIIGGSFYGLGASKVYAERKQPIVGTDSFKNAKGVRPNMFLLRLGFKF